MKPLLKTLVHETLTQCKKKKGEYVQDVHDNHMTMYIQIPKKVRSN